MNIAELQWLGGGVEGLTISPWPILLPLAATLFVIVMLRPTAIGITALAIAAAGIGVVHLEGGGFDAAIVLITASAVLIALSAHAASRKLAELSERLVSAETAIRQLERADQRRRMIAAQQPLREPASVLMNLPQRGGGMNSIPEMGTVGPSPGRSNHKHPEPTR